MGEKPATTVTVLGVQTGWADLHDAAVAEYALAGTEKHVVVPVCPEHAVDIYRGRIAGVQMAWRLAAAAVAPLLPTSR